MSLINRKAVKQFILDTAKAEGKTEFTRVGSASFDWIENQLSDLIKAEVVAQPSKGKTLSLGESQPAEDNGEPVKAPGTLPCGE